MSEWLDLPTLADVAAAQAAGDEIEVRDKFLSHWIKWRGKFWSDNNKYRARAKPMVRKIKILGWIDPVSGQTITRREDQKLATWDRYPKLDDEVEVPL